MRKSETHHHNKVEHKEKREAAGVAQEACEGRSWSQTSDQRIMNYFVQFLTNFGQHCQRKNNTNCNDDEQQPAVFIPGASEKQVDINY